MKPRYAWKAGMRWPVAVDVVVKRLAALRSRYGKTPAKLVVRDARSRTSPLHPCFNWDNTQAAERYRQMQARWLMSSIVVVTVEGPELPPVRALVAIDVGNSQKDYVPVQLVLRDATLRARFLADALAEATRWMQKYQHLKELAEVMTAIRTAAERLTESAEVA